MFVAVTVFGVWLGWNLPQVRELERILEQGVSVCPENGRHVLHKVPLSWRILGAEPVSFLWLQHDASDSELSRIRALFPETATIHAEPDR
jgi:hypothetical protein